MPRCRAAPHPLKKLPLSGKLLQQAAVAEARRTGWLVAHFTAAHVRPGVVVTPVKADGKGFPDLFLLRDCAKVIEVKGDGDSLRADQRKWLAAFEAAGIPTLVLTPKLYRDGILDTFLA